MKRHTLRMLLTAVLLILVLGCTSVVYGDTLAGGKVLTGNTKPSTAAGTSKTTTSGTGASSGSIYTGTQSSAGTGYVSSGTGYNYSPSATTATTGTRVQTGYLEDAMPFMIVMGMGIFLLLAFSHLQLNQTRYGKSEKYAKELKDFRRACSIDR